MFSLHAAEGAEIEFFPVGTAEHDPEELAAFGRLDLKVVRFAGAAGFRLKDFTFDRRFFSEGDEGVAFRLGGHFRSSAVHGFDGGLGGGLLLCGSCGHGSDVDGGRLGARGSYGVCFGGFRLSFLRGLLSGLCDLS